MIAPLLLLLAVQPCTGSLKYEGIDITIYALPYIAPLFRNRVESFANLTGANVIVEEAPNLKVLHDEIEADGQSGYGRDAYVFTSTGMPEFASKGYLLDLTDYVTKDTKLDWSDVFPFFRTNNVGYNGRVYALPLDGDILVLLYRKDYFPDGPPTTIEELVKAAVSLNGKDLNNDGIPDVGWCECTGPSTDPTVFYVMGDFFISFLAPLVQSKGSQEGVFFNPTTLMPPTRTEAFEHATDLLYEMYTNATNENWRRCDGRDAKNTYLRSRDAFLNGSCAFSIFWSSNYMVKGVEWDSYVVPYMSHAIFPGSRRVMGKDGRLVECTDDRVCPHAIPQPDGSLVNFAPFAAYGGFVGAVNAASKHTNVAYEFLSYCGQPSFAAEDVVNYGALEPFRRSQLLPQLWDSGFPDHPELVQSFLDASRAVLDNGNILVDLRIPGAPDFITETGRCLDLLVTHAIPRDGMAKCIEDSWASVVEKNGGQQALLALYRASLGLPPLDSTTEDGWTPEVWHIVLIVLGILLLIGLALGSLLRATHSQRLYMKQFDNNVVAERCAIAIAEMDLESVSYLHTLERPNNIQRAFIQIINRLKQYKAYMPQSLFAVDEDETASDEVPLDSKQKFSSDTSKMSDSSNSRTNTHAKVSQQMKRISTKRQATQVTIYLSGINQGDKSPSVVGDMQTHILNVVSHVTKNGSNGVLLYTSGDYITVALNAASTCPTHVVRGCTVGTEIASSLREAESNLQDMLLVAIGISICSGAMIITNAGTEILRAFALFGPTVLRSRETSHISADFPGIVPLADYQVRSTALGHVRMAACALLPLKHRTLTPSSAVLYHAIEMVQAGQAGDEWMYELNEHRTDPLKEALHKVAEGRSVAEGIRAIQQLAQQNWEDRVLQHTLSLALQYSNDVSARSMATAETTGSAMPPSAPLPSAPPTSSPGNGVILPQLVPEPVPGEPEALSREISKPHLSSLERKESLGQVDPELVDEPGTNEPLASPME